VQPLLKTVNLSKSFAAAPVVQRINLEIWPGEVVGLAGESGSGKSALSMLLAGLYAPSAGEIYFAGRQLRYPFRARALGIEVIHQTPDLAEQLDITGNIFLGHELGWPLLGQWVKIPNRRQMESEAARILEQLDVRFSSLRTKATFLSSEQRQLIAIARVMTRPARLVIVDDPTLLLSYPYQQKLLSLIQTWQQKGTAVIFSSNNLDHLLAVTDRIVILRQGQVAAEFRTDGAHREEIVAAMVGATDVQRLTPIIWALDNYARAREQAERLRYQQTLLERDSVAQETLQRQLLEQLTEQIHALDSANVALQDAQRRLLIEREEERKHLARELHDQVIQDLLSINYQLETAEATPTLSNTLTEVRNSIRGIIDDLRHICGNLRPPTIDSLGLGAALQSFTGEWASRTGITVALDLDPHLRRLPEAIELAIFRIVQEGLNNVRKHAHASAVEITLRRTSPRTLMLTIADNGRGLADDFDLSTLSAEGHYGLLGISERVALLGGHLKLQNQPGSGLLLQAEIPHPRIPPSSQA
jgi:signal transduction histidine kinase